MNNNNDGTGSVIERMTVHECWALLSKAEVGRLGVTSQGTVEIYPVNFVVDQERIVFRTAPGQKLLALILSHAVAFEIDGWDDRRAWSVLVKGTAELLQTVSEIREVSHTSLQSWAPEPKNTYVQIQPSEVTGRRFDRAPAAASEPIWYW